MSELLEIVMKCDEIIKIFLFVLAGIADITAIIAFIRSKEKKGMKIIVIVIFTLFFGLLLAASLLNYVPNVVGDSYKDANQKIIQSEFRVGNEPENPEYIVVDQYPKEGSISFKRRKIMLTYKSKESIEKEDNEKKINRLREENKDLINFACSFREMQIKVYDSQGDLVFCIGRRIENVPIKQFKLTYSLDNTFFEEYEIIDNFTPTKLGDSYVIKNIPLGKYQFNCELEGYEKYETDEEININKEYLSDDDTYAVTFSLVNKNVKTFIPYTVSILDENYEDITEEATLTLYPELLMEDGYSLDVLKKGGCILGQRGDEFNISIDYQDTQYIGNFILNEENTIFLLLKKNGDIKQLKHIDYLNGFWGN